MKTRVRVLRKISDIPKVKGFKPYGKDLKKSDEHPLICYTKNAKPYV